MSERKAPTAMAVAALLVGAVLIWRGMPLWWFGASMLITSGLVLARVWSDRLSALGQRLQRPQQVLGQRLTPGPVALEAFYYALVIFVATVMMWDIVEGERPVSHDHTVHYFKAWQLHQHFLSEGRLFGWSSRMFAGYPVNYLYPMGTDLWVNLVHALSFGLLSFSRAYGVAFWAFHVLTGVAGYRFGKVLGGPHVGLLTALLLLTDMSEFRLGGWAYSVNYGVWPQALSLAFMLLALCRLPGIAKGRGLADIAAFGLWAGLSILTHPIQLIFMALLLVAMTMAAGFSAGVKTPTAVFRLLWAYAMALLVGAIWLLPFMTLRSETFQMGVWWDTTYEMGKALVDLELFPGSLGLVVAFGALGLVLAVRSGRFILVATALLGLIVPAVSNSTFIDEFHLPFLSQAFTKVQFIRMSTMVKPFWFGLTAFFVVSFLREARGMARRLSGTDPRPMPLPRLAALSVLLCLLTLPILVPAAQAFWTHNVAKSLRTTVDRPLLADREQMVEWVLANLPDDGWYRVGIFAGHNHDLIDVAAQLDRPIYKRGFTPCTNFVYKMNTKEREVLEAVNVRFVLSKRHLPREDYEQIQRFGMYRVYKYRHWKPDPFEVVQGQGEVSLERFSDEEVVLKAAPGSSGTIRINVSYFPRWHAYRDGKELPITPTYLDAAPDKTGFITVELAPGTYRFAFERSYKEWLGGLLTCIGLLLAFFMWRSDRGPRDPLRLTRLFGAVSTGLDRLSGAEFVRLRSTSLAVVALLLLALGVGLAEWRPPIALQELDGAAVSKVRFDFLERLHRARVNIEYRAQHRGCMRQGDRFVCRDRDGNLDNSLYVGSSPATIVEYTMVRCVRARPVDKGVLSINFTDVPVADAVVGYYGIERAGRLLKRKRPVNFQVHVGGRRLYAEETKEDNKMHWFKVPVGSVSSPTTDVSFLVKSANVSKRFFCFNAQMVNL